MSQSAVEEVRRLMEQGFIESDPPEQNKQIVESDEAPFIQLIANATTSSVLKKWVEQVFLNLQRHYSFCNAKGCSRAEILENNFLGGEIGSEKWEKGVKTLENMDVQSLPVHILNAVMAIWPIIEMAELDKKQQKLLLAAISMHDFNKMVTDSDERELRLTDDTQEEYKKVFLRIGRQLGLWDFVLEDQWQDVAFLAANAENKRGENRYAGHYPHIQLDIAELEDLAPFVRLADLVVSIAKHPADLIQKKMRGPQAELDKVLGNQYSIHHHSVVENRGLLTQIIHNAVQEKVKKAGWKPWIYFPDGITYLAPKKHNEVNLEDLADQVRKRLTESVVKHLGSLVKRGGKGIDYKPEFAELLDPNRAGELLIQRTLSILNHHKKPVTEERKAKTVLRSGVSLTLDTDYPASINADRLAEGMFGLSKLLTAYYKGERQTYGEALLVALGLEDLREAFKAIEVTGGVGYPWYYAAGHYLKRHTGLDDSDLAQRMLDAFNQVVKDLGEAEREPSFGFLEEYLARVVSIDQAPVEHWDFQGELQRYQQSKKARGGKPVCVLCNSPFPNRKLTDGPFSNRSHLGKKDSRPGICEVCQAEELLRRFSLGQTIREEGDSKFLHLYPTYFFTSITGKAMRKAYDQMKQTSFAQLAKTYREKGYSVAELALSDAFEVQVSRDKPRVERVEYSDHSLHAYYLLGFPAIERKKKVGEGPSETEAWMMPALLTLLAPLVFGVKVVASSSSRPPYPTGADFPNKTDMAVLESPHSYWMHAMGRQNFELTRLEPALEAAMAVYTLTSDAYKDGKGYTSWNQLNRVCRDLDTDPLSMFGLADRISEVQKGRLKQMSATDGLMPHLAEQLIRQYNEYVGYLERVLEKKGVNRMAMIEELVDRYAKFYRAGTRAAYSRLRPLSLAIEEVLKTPAELEPEDLQIQIEGRIYSHLDGIRDRVSQGYIPKGVFTDEERKQPVEDFVTYFLDKVFEGYCQGNRAILRKRQNQLKNGAEAQYVKKYARRPDKATKTNNLEGDHHV